MRDPKRLNRFYDELKAIHMTYFPDWRFGQLMMNFLGWTSRSIDPFFPEETEMITLLHKYVDYVTNGGE